VNERLLHGGGKAYPGFGVDLRSELDEEGCCHHPSTLQRPSTRIVVAEIGSLYRSPGSPVFCHAALVTPLDPSKLTVYARKALRKAGIAEAFRPWHGMRHTSSTETAASGVAPMFVQAKAGHAQGSTTERYLHAARTSYPDAAELAEARMFGGLQAEGRKLGTT